MSGQIFISYRREESRWSARSLHDRLCRDFDPKQIFMDIDAIALGEDFVEAIETTVAKCDVLIAVIGNNWLTSKDDQGNRRLDNPQDFVRMEIGAALKRKIRVIPVLVDRASMPRADDLPEDLKLLVRRNALLITDTSFDGDCQRLAAAIRLVLEKAAAEERQRLEAEQRQREEQERLEAEQRQREAQQRLAAEQREKERLEAEQREKQCLEAEQREKERLAAEQRQREEKERLEVQERLEAERRQREAQERLKAEQPPSAAQERLQAEQREKERLETQRRERKEKERQQAEAREGERRQQEDQERLEAESRQKETPVLEVPASLKKQWRLLLAVGSGVVVCLLSFGLLFRASQPHYAVQSNSPTPILPGAEWLAEAKRYLDAKDYPQALPPLQKAAAAGNAEAMRDLGALYENGWSVVTPDWAESQRWYRKAAMAGDTIAKQKLLPTSSPSVTSQTSPSPASSGAEWFAEAPPNPHATNASNASPPSSKALSQWPRDPGPPRPESETSSPMPAAPPQIIGTGAGGSVGIDDYFAALPPQAFTHSTPSELLKAVRRGKGGNVLDRPNGYMSLKGDGAQPSLQVALFLDAKGRPLLAIAWGHPGGPDFTHLSLFTEKDGRMVPENRATFPVGDSDGRRFELPREGLAVVVRDGSDGKVLSRWSWNPTRARFEPAN